MDILKPELVWIGNRCYRKNNIKDNTGYNPEDEEFDDVSSNDCTHSDEICDADLNIEETEKGYTYRMTVPNAFHKFIIGKKGETRKRLETDTHTNIIVPKYGEINDEIVIHGHNKRSIVSAKTRLDILIDSRRQKLPFTHFLSIPVSNERVIVGFEDFKFNVLNEFDGARGLDASLFQYPHKLHLTIGTLVLLNDSEIQKATDLLSRCQEELVNPIVRGERLDVLIQGLEYMNDDPSAVDVLYAKVDPGDACDRVQVLADQLVDKFTSAGLMQREHERVKLHATVMNTVMRKDPPATEVPKSDRDASHRSVRGGIQRESFDASQILKKFGNYTFGPLHISTIHLSQRYSEGEDGYYTQVAALTLPS